MTGFKQVKLDEKGRGQIKKKKKEKKATCKTAAELAVKNRPTLHTVPNAQIFSSRNHAGMAKKYEET